MAAFHLDADQALHGSVGAVRPGDLIFATVMTGPDTQTLPISASRLVTSTGIDWGRMTAIGTVVVLPMFVAGLAVERWLVTGLTLGA